MTTIEASAAPARPDLPSLTVLRYRDLKALGICSTYAQLRKRIANENFPSGRWLSENIRGWTLSEVQQWLDARPTTRPDTPAIKRSRKRQQALKRQRQRASA